MWLPVRLRIDQVKCCDSVSFDAFIHPRTSVDRRFSDNHFLLLHVLVRHTSYSHFLLSFLSVLCPFFGYNTIISICIKPCGDRETASQSFSCAHIALPGTTCFLATTRCSSFSLTVSLSWPALPKSVLFTASSKHSVVQ